jgi:hypothetical protein
MKRREFIGLLGGAAAWPLAGRAQQPAKLATIGLLGGGSAAQQSKWTAAFLQRLQELGWIEGRNIAIEYRWTEGSNERAAEFAAEFVRLKVDVIVTSGTPIVIATKRATSVIPIIFARPRYTRLSCKNDYLPTPNHVNRSAASALLTEDSLLNGRLPSVRPRDCVLPQAADVGPRVLFERAPELADRKPRFRAVVIANARAPYFILQPEQVTHSGNPIDVGKALQSIERAPREVLVVADMLQTAH